MMMYKPIRLIGLLAAGALLLPQLAHAVGTVSGTAVNNTVTLSYSVGTVAQPPVISNTASFVVDNRVNLLVTEVGGALTVTVPGDSSTLPGDVTTMTTFNLSNLGNTAQGYTLTAAGNVASGQTLFGGIDAFDVTIQGVMVDINNNGLADDVFVAGATVDILSLAADANRNVFVFSTIPAGVANAQAGLISLAALTNNDGTATATASNNGSADDPNAVDVVFYDAAGADDAANDGRHSARDGYLIQTAQLSVTKSATTIWDAVNTNTNPKSIPGAYIRYVISISNSGTANADLTTIQDVLPVSLNLDAELLSSTCAATNGAGNPAAACATETGNTFGAAVGESYRVTVSGSSRTTTAFDLTGDIGDANNDGGEYSGGAGGTVAVDLSIALPVDGGYAAGELRPGESVSIIFNAVLQ